MLDLWTEDGVIFQLGQPTLLGKKAIQAQYEKVGAEYPGFKVLSYVPKFKEVRVFDGWAYELLTIQEVSRTFDAPIMSVKTLAGRPGLEPG